MEEEDLRQMALALAVAAAVAEEHQTRAVAEEVVQRMKAMVGEEAEGGLPKKLEHLVPVLVSWATEVAGGWRMDGVVQAKEVEEADPRMEVVQLDLWEEAEARRQR